MPEPIILLRGLPGSGKTTTSALLRDLLTPSVRVSNDAIRYLAKPRDFSRMTLETSERACIDLALSYVRGGFVPVIDGVFYDPEFLDSVTWELEQVGVRLIVFTLEAELEDLLDRNDCRLELARMPAERIRTLHSGFTSYGIPVPVKDGTAEEIADDVKTLFEQHTDAPAVTTGTGTELLFLRHAEPQYPHRRYPDHMTMPLSPHGRAQALAARQAVERFAPDEIYSSDMRRAQETAEIAGATAGVPVKAVPQLRERYFPSLAGLTHEEVDHHTNGMGKQILSNGDLWSPPDAEGLEEAAARVGTFIDDLTGRPGPRRVLVVAHGGPHAWLVCRLLGVPLRVNRALDLGYAAFSHFSFQPDCTGQIRFINRNASAVGWHFS